MPRRLPSMMLAVLCAAVLPLGAGSFPAHAAEVHPAPPRWSPPLARPLEVSGPFQAPPHRYGPGHRGIDIPAAPGEPVVAPSSGTVSFVGRVVDRDVISIRVDARTVLSLEPVAGAVAEGERVVQGQVIGAVGTGGDCSAECVHLGVRIASDAGGVDYVNPLRFYLEKPVLLPW